MVNGWRMGVGSPWASPGQVALLTEGSAQRRMQGLAISSQLSPVTGNSGWAQYISVFKDLTSLTVEMFLRGALDSPRILGLATKLKLNG
jgi:hypothetical protein